MTDQKYALRYTWDTECRKEGYTKEDAIEENHGLSDAFLGISIIKPKDGSYSQLLMSIDGETEKELTQKDIFKAWLTMGLQLSDNNTLQGWKKQIVDELTKAVREFFKQRK